MRPLGCPIRVDDESFFPLVVGAKAEFSDMKHPTWSFGSTLTHWRDDAGKELLLDVVCSADSSTSAALFWDGVECISMLALDPGLSHPFVPVP